MQAVVVRVADLANVSLGVAEVESNDDLQRAADSIAAEHELPHGSEIAVLVSDGSWAVVPVIVIDELLGEITGEVPAGDEDE